MAFGGGIGGIGGFGGIGGIGANGGIGGIGGAGGIGSPASMIGVAAPAALQTDPVALMTSTDGTALYKADGNYCTNPWTMAALDDPKQLHRWESWVRTYAMQQALLSRIRIKVDAPAQDVNDKLKCANRKDLGGAVELYDVEVGFTGAGATASALPIVRLERPAIDVFKKQTDLVINWADLRTERLNEIVAQITPQYPFWGSVVNLHPTRTPMTLELLHLAFIVSVSLEVRLKHIFACPRPMDLSAQVQPVFMTPGHGSFPGGHATQAYFVTHVLSRLLNLDLKDERYVQLQRQCARIAINRTVAGVHFPVDSIAGRLLGETLGEYFVSRCINGTKLGCPKPAANEYTKTVWQPRKFVVGTTPAEIGKLGPQEFLPFSQSLDLNANQPSAPWFYQSFGVPVVTAPPAESMLSWLWECAQMEWGRTNCAFDCE